MNHSCILMFFEGQLIKEMNGYYSKILKSARTNSFVRNSTL